MELPMDTLQHFDGPNGISDGCIGAFSGPNGISDGRIGAFGGPNGVSDGRIGAFDAPNGIFDGCIGAFDGPNFGQIAVTAAASSSIGIGKTTQPEGLRLRSLLYGPYCPSRHPLRVC
jgi:hypothetical protein